MHLRPAMPSDYALLQYWNTKPHVIAATGGDADWNWQAELTRFPAWRKLLVAENEGRPIGFVQILDPERDEANYWGRWTRICARLTSGSARRADLGRGYGTEIMRLALERCFADAAVKAVLLDPLASNTRAHRFYERFGFRPIERRTFGTDDCVVYRLEREVW